MHVAHFFDIEFFEWFISLFVSDLVVFEFLISDDESAFLLDKEVIKAIEHEHFEFDVRSLRGFYRQNIVKAREHAALRIRH